MSDLEQKLTEVTISEGPCCLCKQFTPAIPKNFGRGSLNNLIFAGAVREFLYAIDKPEGELCLDCFKFIALNKSYTRVKI